MVSWIGAHKVNLDETVWCNVFNLPTVSIEEEAPMRSKSRNEIFCELVGEDNLRNGSWINASDLPKEASVRLAISIIIHTIVPKKRNKDQIKEKEARILYALMSGQKLNIGREIVNHVRQAFSKKTLPLCLTMHLMRIMKLAKVDIEIAGTEDVKRFTSTSMIDGNTLSRIGFKRDHTHWIHVGRGKEKLTPGSHPAAAHEGEEIERDEQGERQQEERFGHEESTPVSAKPGPSTSSRPTPTTPPHLAHQLNTLQASIDHLSAHLTEQIAYLSATVHSKLESMDSKLENLQTRVQSCETKLDHLTSDSPFPSPNYSPSYSPSSPSYSPPSTPIEISSDSQPTPLSIIPPHRPIPQSQNPHPSN